jgi:hypothetical protein
MWTTALQGFGAVAALLAPLLTWVGLRLRLRRAELTDVQDRLDVRDAEFRALLEAYFDLRYWVVKGGTGAPPTLPDSLTVAAVRARVSA